jgi:hypothetical protein
MPIPMVSRAAMIGCSLRSPPMAMSPSVGAKGPGCAAAFSPFHECREQAEFVAFHLVSGTRLDGLCCHYA